MNLMSAEIHLRPNAAVYEIRKYDWSIFILKSGKEKESLLYLRLLSPTRSLSPCAVLSLPVLDLLGLASGSRGATSPSAERQYHAAGRGPDNNKTYFSHIQHLHSLRESSLCNAGTKTYSHLTPRVCFKGFLCPKTALERGLVVCFQVIAF